MEDSVLTCPGCGAANPSYQQPVVVAPMVAQLVQPAKIKEELVLPRENEPLSAWSYFWLKILFAIPVVGFVFLIVFSCSGANVNRRSFARSYWYGLLVAVIIITVVAILSLAMGTSLWYIYYSST